MIYLRGGQGYIINPQVIFTSFDKNEHNAQIDDLIIGMCYFLPYIRIKQK